MLKTPKKKKDDYSTKVETKAVVKKNSGFFSLFNKKSPFSRKPTLSKEDIVALEILEDRVYVAQLSGTENKWRLSKFDYTHFEQKINFDDENSRKYAGRVISGLLRRANISTKSAALSIPVENAIIRTIESPLMTDEELKEAIKTKTLWENLIDVESNNFEDLSIYHQVVSRNTERNVMEILFVASKLSEIEKIMQIATESSLKPVVIDVSCFSIKSAMDINQSSQSSKSETSAVLTIGSKENYLMIIQGNNHYITQIFVGTEEIQAFKDSENDPAAVFPFISKYSLLVEQAVSDFNTKAKQAGIPSVTVIEVASPINALANIIANLSNQLRTTEVRVLNALELLKLPEHLKKKIDTLNNPSVASAVVGLATRKLDVFGYYKFVEAVKNVNLLPNREELIDKTLRGRKLKFAGIFAALFILISTSVFYKYFDEIYVKYKEVQYKYAELDSKNQNIIREISAINKNIKNFKQATANIEHLNSNQKESYDFLMAIKNSVNSKLVLDNISYQKSGEIVILGRAKSDDAIVSFMDKIRSNENMRQVTIENMSSDPDSGIKEFTIRCMGGEQG